MSLSSFHVPAFCRRLAVVAVYVTVFLPTSHAQSGNWDATIEAGDQALDGRDFDRAEKLFQLALVQAGSGDWRRPASMVRLARLYQASGDYAKPETLFREADPLARDSFKDPEYAEFLNEVGRYYHTRRKYEIAEHFYLQGFSGRVKAHGKEHAAVADSINNLAVLYENQGRFPKAEVYYRHSLEIREKVLGAEHIKTAETCEHFARLLHKLTRGDEAAPLEERARAVRKPDLDAAVGSPIELEGLTTRAAGIKPPVLVDQVDPEYTEEARIARQEGAVAIRADIDIDGIPKNLVVVRTLGLGLDEKAIEAVKSWRFVPARQTARRVPYRATLEINFRLL